MGVQKGELLDKEADNLAVRLALAETQILNETKDVLEKEGVSLDSLSSVNQKNIQVILSYLAILFHSQSHVTYSVFTRYYIEEQYGGSGKEHSIQNGRERFISIISTLWRIGKGNIYPVFINIHHLVCYSHSRYESHEGLFFSRNNIISFNETCFRLSCLLRKRLL